MSSSFAVVRKFISVVLILTLLISPEFSYAQSMFVSTLPEPGKMVGVSPAFTPVLVKGLVIHPDQPLNFDFIVDSGNASVEQAAIKEQSEKIVRYFLAALTVPEESLWVNLSPYEKDRIIDDALGQTVLGRDMLAQDYVLKQLTASLIYPEDNLGKAFWSRIYKEAQEKFGTTDIPVDTFNKVWITPEKAEVFEKGNAVYVTQAKLKVMLDSDYTAMRHSERSEESQGLLVGVKDTTDQIIQRSFVAKDAPQDDGRVKAIIREVILPAIEKEVNEGKNFATLRQVYYAAILAKWYRELVQDTLMAQGYVGTNKITGVTTDEKALKEQIYQRYIAAYKQGVFNYIKEEPGTATGEAMPKKYFSGGLDKFGDIKLDMAQDSQGVIKVGQVFRVDFAMDNSQSAIVFRKIDSNRPVIILLGKPGSGKGTVATSLTGDKLKQVSTGDLLREKVAVGTPAGLEAKSYMEKGALVPDEVIIRILKEEVQKPENADKGFLFDGFPRTVAQAQALDVLLKEMGMSVGYALHMEVSDGLVLERLGGRWVCPICGTPYNVKQRPPKVAGKCDKDGADLIQRKDDKEDVIRQRLQAYQEQTSPLINFYETSDRLEAANASDHIERIMDAVRVSVGMEPKIDASMAPIQETSSALSDKVDPAMINEVVQWVQRNPVLTVVGVEALLITTAVVVGSLDDWKGNIKLRRLMRKNPDVVQKINERLSKLESYYKRPDSILRLLEDALKYESKGKKWEVEISRVPPTAEEGHLASGPTGEVYTEIDRPATPGYTEIKIVEVDSAQTGGIDIKNIDVNKTGNARIHFDNAVLQEVFSGGFEGFTPVFIQMMPIESPLAMFGLN